MKLILGIALLLWCGDFAAANPPLKDCGLIEVRGYTSISTFSLYAPVMANYVKLTNQANSIECVIDIPVHAFKSGEKALDYDFYRMIKSEIYPNIQMTIALDTSSLNSETSNKKVQLQISGKRNSEVVRIVNLKVIDGILSINGSTELLLSDYYLTPPVKFLGFIRVKNNVNINFAVATRLP